MIDIVAKIPEKPGGPRVREFYFSAYNDDIEEAAAKIINDCRVVEEGTVIDALLDLGTKRIKGCKLPDPDRMMCFIYGFDAFYEALDRAYLEAMRNKKMKNEFEIGFSYRVGLLDESRIEDGLETINIKVGESHVEAIKNGGPSVIKTWLRRECKFLLHRKYKNLDWCQIQFEDSLDEFMYEITKRAFGEKEGIEGGPINIEKDKLDHLFKNINFQTEEPKSFVEAFEVIAEYDGYLKGEIRRVFLLPRGLNNKEKIGFARSEITKEMAARHCIDSVSINRIDYGAVE